MKEKTNCGKLTDFLNVDFKLKKDGSHLNFEGNGFCVTPNAGCLQKIQSKIRTKQTALIFSKIMDTGVVNPLFAGVILGSLLGSPADQESNYDHEVRFDVEGSRISVNEKPLLN